MNDTALDCVFVNLFWFERFQMNDVIQFRSKLFGAVTQRERRGDRRKNVAAMKAVADRLAKEAFIGQGKRAPLPFPFTNPPKQTVVGADEPLLGAVNDERL